MPGTPVVSFVLLLVVAAVFADETGDVCHDGACTLEFEPDGNKYYTKKEIDGEPHFNIPLASGAYEYAKSYDCSVFNLMGKRKVFNGTRTLPSRQKVYCEFSHGFSWTLLSAFEQPRGASMSDLTRREYRHFSNDPINNIWIHRNAEFPIPATPAQDGYFHVASHDWESFLQIGHKYKLRQQFFKTKKRNLIFDVAYTFTYTGILMQDDAKNSVQYKNDRAWVLTDRQVLEDTSGIQWDVKNETVRFWLPFSSSVVGRVYTGCLGFEFSSNGCTKSNGDSRRPGSAGIIGATADEGDPAASFAPHLDASHPYADIVYVNQANHIYGATSGSGGPIFLTYWIAPVYE